MHEGPGYLLKSGDMHEELDATDIVDSFGQVQTWDPTTIPLTNEHTANLDNDPTQVWIVEKAN